MKPELYEDLIGIPFEHAGRVPFRGKRFLTYGRGIDCYGVLLEIYRRQGIMVADPFACTLPDWGTREPGADPLTWIKTNLKDWTKIPEPVDGCAVAFSRHGKAADHVGVMVSPYQFVHAIEVAGTVVSRLDRTPWADIRIGFYEYRP